MNVALIYSSLYKQKQTYSMCQKVGGTEATGVCWPQASWWRRLQGTEHSRRPPEASTSTEATYGDTSWLKVGWSTERAAAPGCSYWCCECQAGTETCTPRGCYLQCSWGNPSGSDRTAGCWDTPTSCWQSSGDSRSHWPGWETEWADCTRQASCGEAGTRGSSDQDEGERGCVRVPALCQTGSHRQGWHALEGCCSHQG